MFQEFVTSYDSLLVSAVQDRGGYVRIHSHGRLKDILHQIVSTGCRGLDPLEPPPQGDVELKYVREKYGKDMVLFDNLEASDVENLDTAEFEKKVIAALKDGTAGKGRGFVLMPSSCPYGRRLSSRAMKNYEKIIECVENF